MKDLAASAIVSPLQRMILETLAKNPATGPEWIVEKIRKRINSNNVYSALYGLMLNGIIDMRKERGVHPREIGGPRRMYSVSKFGAMMLNEQIISESNSQVDIQLFRLHKWRHLDRHQPRRRWMRHLLERGASCQPAALAS